MTLSQTSPGMSTDLTEFTSLCEDVILHILTFIKLILITKTNFRQNLQRGFYRNYEKFSNLCAFLYLISIPTE